MKMMIAVAALIALAALIQFCFVPGRALPPHRVRRMRLRLRLRLHPGRGFASTSELWWRWGRFAAFRSSSRARRSLSWWQRAVRPGEHSVVLGRAQYRHQLRVPVEEHILVMAPPRTGKTGFLASVVLDYPGPVISTTTKHDVFLLTSGIRALRGPVHVFNPQGIGNVPSTFRWSPVHGCEDQAVAIRRADAFAHAVSQKGVEDASFWSAKASDYLRAYFHAAALSGSDMRMVARWVLGADPEEPEDILAMAGAVQWAMTLAELRSEAQKTASTVRMVMSRAMSFMADPALAESVLPGDEPFDVAAFLRDCGTLYMIAESPEEETPVAPLFAAMASEFHYEAALLGQASPGGRLDPPLLMGLDEVTQICPVPLPVWLVGLRRQRHPGLRGRARRGPAGQPLGGVRQAGRPGHLLGEGAAAGDQRHRDAAVDVAAVRTGRVPRARPGPLLPPRCRDARHDPPAAVRIRAGGTRRAVTSARPAPARVEASGLPPGPQGRVCCRLDIPGTRPRTRDGREMSWPVSSATGCPPTRSRRARVPLGRPMTSTPAHPDAVSVALLQLAQLAERLAVLDSREAEHHLQLAARLGELATQVGELASAVDGTGDQLDRLASRILGDHDDDARPPAYRPGPAPRWWQLDGDERDAALDRLRSWVAQVYRPGYGQLAATLGPCWEHHPLCLYGLDLLAELWSVLYLQPARTPAAVSAQAEFQSRIAPAIAEQLMIETTRCAHATTRRTSSAVISRSTP